MNAQMKERVATSTVVALIVLALALAAAVVYKLSALVFLVLIASILTMGMDKPARWLQTRLHFPRAVAIIVVMLLVAFIILGVISVFAITAITQGIQFAQHTWPRLQTDLLKFGEQPPRRASISSPTRRASGRSCARSPARWPVMSGPPRGCLRRARQPGLHCHHHHPHLLLLHLSG